MAVSFLVQNPIKINGIQGDVQQAAYTIGDAVLEATTVKRSRPTTYPTQFGLEAADSLVLEPITYTLKGMTGTDPIGLTPSDTLANVGVTAAITAGGALASGAVTVGSAFLGGGSSRGQATWEFLSGLWQNKRRFDVQTNNELIQNLVITSLIDTSDFQTSASLLFEVEFTQIPISTSEGQLINNVSFLPASDLASTMGQELKSFGEKSLESVNEIVDDALNFIGDLFS